jgi:hypothetical protein
MAKKQKRKIAAKHLAKKAKHIRKTKAKKVGTAKVKSKTKSRTKTNRRSKKPMKKGSIETAINAVRDTFQETAALRSKLVGRDTFED